MNGTRTTLGFMLLVVACVACTRPKSEVEAKPNSSPAGAVAASKARLDYIELVTGGAGTDERLPLIVAIHGLGSKPEHFKRVLVDFPKKARVILPRAPKPWRNGYAWFTARIRNSNPQMLADGIARAADQVAEFIRFLALEKPTVGKPILCGFSQGGMISFAVAVRHPELIRLAIPISGVLPRPLWPSSGGARSVLPIRALHGVQDALVLIEPTRETVAHLKGAGFDAELKEYENVGHGMSPAMREELHKLIEQAL